MFISNFEYKRSKKRRMKNLRVVNDESEYTMNDHEEEQTTQSGKLMNFKKGMTYRRKIVLQLNGYVGQLLWAEKIPDPEQRAVMIEAFTKIIHNLLAEAEMANIELTINPATQRYILAKPDEPIDNTPLFTRFVNHTSAYFDDQLNNRRKDLENATNAYKLEQEKQTKAIVLGRNVSADAVNAHIKRIHELNAEMTLLTKIKSDLARSFDQFLNVEKQPLLDDLEGELELL